MLYREIIAVCSKIHTKHINALCGQNLELLNTKPGDTLKKPLGFTGLIHFKTKYTKFSPHSCRCSDSLDGWTVRGSYRGDGEVFHTLGPTQAIKWVPRLLPGR